MTGSERCSEPAFLLSEILFNELPFLIVGICQKHMYAIIGFLRRIDDLGRVVIPKEIRSGEVHREVNDMPVGAPRPPSDCEYQAAVFGYAFFRYSVGVRPVMRLNCFMK